MKAAIICILLLGVSGPGFSESGYDHVVVFYNLEISGSNQGLKAAYDDHIDFIQKLVDEGKATLFGKFEDGDELIIFKDLDISEAKKILEHDPVLIRKLYRPEYFPTNIRHGDFCKANFKQPVELNFVRYTSHITKYNIQQVPQLLKMHDDYLKQISETGNVLAEGIFANSDGGFIIVKGHLANKVITNDPTFAAGFTIPEINNILIPKKTFCNSAE